VHKQASEWEGGVMGGGHAFSRAARQVGRQSIELGGRAGNQCLGMD
jgi:hypothetical protein